MSLLRRRTTPKLPGGENMSEAEESRIVSDTREKEDVHEVLQRLEKKVNAILEQMERETRSRLR